MAILITNDDGLHAPGIEALIVGLSGLDQAIVIAPSQERSGASHSLTMNTPLRMREVQDGCYAVDGTPVDCVYIGVHRVFDEPPGLVVSGINLGANLGDDVFYSGTVGAAREGALHGIPSLAVSLHLDGTRGEGSPNFASAVHFARQVVTWMKANPVPEETFLNLNIPDRPLDQISGLKLCPLGRRHYEPKIESCVDPRGRDYFWVGGHPVEDGMTEGTDGWWIAQGWATLTPIGLDQTAHGALSIIAGGSLV
jgi:5'-nucleotidase